VLGESQPARLTTRRRNGGRLMARWVELYYRYRTQRLVIGFLVAPLQRPDVEPSPGGCDIPLAADASARSRRLS
jgi:hypothetical protein